MNDRMNWNSPTLDVPPPPAQIGDLWTGPDFALVLTETGWVRDTPVTTHHRHRRVMP